MATDTTRNATTVSASDYSAELLEATVVRYREEPDRCTVAPVDVNSDRRFTAWLSVNTDALVTLDEMR